MAGYSLYRYLQSCSAFPGKDVKVMMVDRQEVTAGGEAIGIYVKTDGTCARHARLRDAWGNECSPAQNLRRAGIIL